MISGFNVDDESGKIALSQHELVGSSTIKRTDADGEDGRPIFALAKFLVNIVSNIGILITFGAIFPPLAVVICLSILANTRFVQLMIGRLLTKADALHLPSYGHQLDQDCEGAAKAFRHVIWLLLVFTCLFYSLFVFDILGDSVGWRRALWAPLTMICLPLAIYFGVVVLKCISRCQDDDSRETIVDTLRESTHENNTNDEFVRSSLIHTVSQGSGL